MNQIAAAGARPAIPTFNSPLHVALQQNKVLCFKNTNVVKELLSNFQVTIHYWTSNCNQNIKPMHDEIVRSNSINHVTSSIKELTTLLGFIQPQTKLVVLCYNPKDFVTLHKLKATHNNRFNVWFQCHDDEYNNSLLAEGTNFWVVPVCESYRITNNEESTSKTYKPSEFKEEISRIVSVWDPTCP